MASDEIAPRNRRGVAMLMVLGVVVFFTMLGFMGLETAGKDSQVSGNLVDIKTKEEAAWGGLNLAIGAMQSNPAATVAQLQAFIADSSTSAKHQWFQFAGGSFGLVTGKPALYSLAAGSGDPSGVFVRLVALDIGGAMGSDTGAGITITLESTGQGRNGDQLTIISSYRILGIDVPLQTTTTLASLPTNALYLNGTLPALNTGIQTDGGMYTSGNFSGNINGALVIRNKLRVGGNVDLASGSGLTVDSNAYIGGFLNVNSGNPLTFRQNLGVGRGLFNINDSLHVDGNLNVYGTCLFSSWAPPSVSIKPILRVGGQLWIKDEYLNPASGIYVSGPAFFSNSFQTSASCASTLWCVDSFYTRLQVAGDININNISGNVSADFALFTGTQQVVIGTTGSPNMTVVHDFNAVGGSVSFPGMGTLRVGGITQICSGVAPYGFNPAWGSTSALALQTKGKLYMKAYAGGQTNPGSKLDAFDTVTVNGALPSGTFGSWDALAIPAQKVFRNQNAAATMPGGQNFNSSTAYAFPPTIPPVAPKYLSQLGVPASDTAVDLASNPPDTLKLSGTGVVKDWNSSVVNFSGVYSAVTPAIASTAALTGANLTSLYNYLKGQGKLSSGSTGYMLVRLDIPIGFSSSATSRFSGKAMFIVDASVQVNYNWPASNGATDYQIIYVPSSPPPSSCSVCTGGGWLADIGTPGPFYGYLDIEKTLGMNVNMRWGTPTNWYGAISFGFKPNTVQGNGGAAGSGLNILLKDPATQAMFNDLSSQLGILRAAGGTVSAGGTTTTSSRTLVLRGPASSVQFVRLGEYR